MGFLIIESNKHAMVFNPSVSQKTSTRNPIRNAVTIIILRLIFNGNVMMKYMNMNGTATPKSRILLHTSTCNNIRTRKRMVNLTGEKN